MRATTLASVEHRVEARTTLAIVVGAFVTGLVIAWAGLPPVRQAAYAPPPEKAVVLQSPRDLWQHAIELYKQNEPEHAWTYLAKTADLDPEFEPRERVRWRLDGAEIALFANKPDEGENWARLGLREAALVPWSVYYRETERMLDTWALRTLLAANRALRGDPDGLAELDRLASDGTAPAADAAYLRARLAERAGRLEQARAAYELFLSSGLHRTHLRRAAWARSDAAERLRRLASSG